MEEIKQTLGEYRVGLSFNPGGSKEVDVIKKIAANFIDVLQSKLTGDPEKDRLIIHAQHLIEDAAMNGVKAVTKPEFKGSYKKTITVMINGKGHLFSVGDILSYDEICELVGQKDLSIMYEHGPHGGLLIHGRSLELKDGMKISGQHTGDA